ncbi:MAG TPA: nucleotidyl transferase AbiEii/AbiGii toxin family protein [Clostridiaceae bacterium]
MNSNIKIETVTFLTPNPFEKRFVNSIIYNYLKEKKLDEFIKEYGLEPFKINVLSIYRTLMDKMVSLVRMSYNTESKEIFSKTRHLYDLHLTYYEIEEFYLNKEHLSEIVNLVRVDEENSRFKDEYPYKEKWSAAPIFDIIQEKQIENSYKFNFGKEFVYGNLPDYSLVVESLKKIQGHLKEIGE